MKNYDYVIQKIKNLPVSFNIKGIETFNMNNITNEILILEYNNSEFVFIEGKNNIVLGWDIEKCKLGENIINYFKDSYYNRLDYYESDYNDIIEYYNKEIEKAQINKDLDTLNKLKDEMKDDLECIEHQKEKYKTVDDFIEELNSTIKNCVSPLRTVNIGDMIVERDSKYINSDMLYSEFNKQIVESSFDIPTEDEWEYICGGGTRTFFRWGNSLKDEANEIFGIETNSDDNNKLIYKPNMFGVCISYNPYRYEIIDTEHYLKGGDGGCSICGGEDDIYIIPIFSTFYRQPFIKRNGSKLSKSFYTYRRIIRL